MFVCSIACVVGVGDEEMRVARLVAASVRTFLYSLYVLDGQHYHGACPRFAPRLVPRCRMSVKLTDARLRGLSQEPHLPGVVLQRNVLRNKHRLQPTTRTRVEANTVCPEIDRVRLWVNERITRSIRRPSSLRYRINIDRMSSFYICTWSSNFSGLPLRLTPLLKISLRL
jgi:hypothetical protein